MSTRLSPPPLDCYEGDSELLPAAEARRRIESATGPVSGIERIATASALGRVLAQDMVSPVDVPGHTNSAMDGYALAAAALPVEGTATLAVVGTAWAGRAHSDPVPEGGAVQIMTGAVMPPGHRYRDHAGARRAGRR